MSMSRIEVEDFGPPLAADKDLLRDLPEDTDVIDVTHSRVESLADLGLTRFKNVKELCVRQNLLSSMHGIEELDPHAESIDLYDNRLEHMDRRLEQFHEIETLDLSFNNFRHIKHLQSMTKMTDLYLCQNAITRISGVEALRNLRQLELGANKIREIVGLDQLVNLEKLWLARNKISKLENLGALKNLKLLSIQSNRITKIEGLEQLTNLEQLYISHNGIEKIEGLEHNTKLTTLDVGSNRLTHLEGVDHLSELEELWANGNKLESFDEIGKQLGHLEQLDTVYFEHNPLQKAAGANYQNRIKTLLPSIHQIDANTVGGRV